MLLATASMACSPTAPIAPSPTMPQPTTGDNFWVDIVFNDSGHLPPVLSNVAGSASYAAGATATTLSSGTTVSDPGGSTTLVSGTVSISSGLFTGDMLAASTSGTNITASYSASTGVLSLTGSDTLAHYQQVLDSVSYSSSNQNPTNYGADPAAPSRGWSMTARSAARLRPLRSISPADRRRKACSVPVPHRHGDGKRPQRG